MVSVGLRPQVSKGILRATTLKDLRGICICQDADYRDAFRVEVSRQYRGFELTHSALGSRAGGHSSV